MVIISFQIIFLIHTLCHSKQLKKIHKFQVIPFLSLQILGLYMNIQGLFHFFIVPVYAKDLVFNSIYCGISFLIKLLPFIFTANTITILILRLETIFKNSLSEWRKRTKIITLSVLWGGYIICFILWIWDLQSPCIHVWKPWDLTLDDDKFMFFCNAYPRKMYVAVVGISAFFVSSGILGLWVTWKLRKIYLHFAKSTNTTANQDRNDILYVTMKKNTIITMCCCISSLIGYMIVLVIGDATETLLCLDNFLNAFFVGLMFKYNARLYNCMCCCFITKAEERETGIEIKCSNNL